LGSTYVIVLILLANMNFTYYFGQTFICRHYFWLILAILDSKLLGLQNLHMVS